MATITKEFLSYLNSQWFTKLPYPTQSFEGLTVLVTGGNSGLGLEAARHFVRLNAKKVIIAVRSLERGVAAADSISESTGRRGAIEVWELDLTSYASVETFAARAETSLERLDVVVENAGISIHHFETAEDNEKITTVNLVSTVLLGLLLLPKLRKTAIEYRKEVVLTFVGSFWHKVAKFPQRESENMLRDLSEESKADMSDRYKTIKLMLLLTVRELASISTQPQGDGRITISYLNPGSVKTNMGRGLGFVFDMQRQIFFRGTEMGSRTLVHGAQSGVDKHGQYLDDCKIGRTSKFVLSDEGARAQQRVWKQLLAKLESIHPGIGQNV